MWKGDVGRATVTKANNSSPNGAGGVQLDDIKGWIETAPNRQDMKDSGRQRQASHMYVGTIFSTLKAVKAKALLFKPTFKLSKLTKCENMIWQETLRGLTMMSGEGEVLFIFTWAGKAQPSL